MQMTRFERTLRGFVDNTGNKVKRDTTIQLPCLRCGQFGFTRATLDTHYNAGC